MRLRHWSSGRTPPFRSPRSRSETPSHRYFATGRVFWLRQATFVRAINTLSDWEPDRQPRCTIPEGAIDMTDPNEPPVNPPMFQPPAAQAAPAYAQPGYPQSYAPQGPSEKYNVLSIVSLVTSVLGISLVGIITGHIGLSQIGKTGEKGRGLAIAGLIVGYAGLAAQLLAVVLLIPLMIAIANDPTLLNTN
ncbi:DUF4190 domain-containing protein [Cryobacterium sp. TMT1-19]|nr:DUF4190 domain-containing protein [Cryobacterium sp. TMT1-19]